MLPVVSFLLIVLCPWWLCRWWFVLESILLAHLNQRVMWGIDITWRPSSSVNCYIVIFFSEQLGQLEPSLVGMFIGWSPTKFMGFLLIRNIQKKQRLKGVKKGCVHIYRYKLFIIHLFFMKIFFLVHSLKAYSSSNWFFLFILKVANIRCFILIKCSEQEARFKKYAIMS